MKKKALVTGANGMLGSALCPILERRGFQVFPTDINSENKKMEIMNICSFTEVFSYIKKIKPDLIFHLAAETDVDKCEVDPDGAYLVNAIGTENIALTCNKMNIELVYMSTGAIFDGEKTEPYTEFDQPNPISVYGKTKLEGEKMIQQLLKNFYIIRAGWMMGSGAKDKKFVGKIFHLIEEKKEIFVVSDRFGSPTYTNDLSEGMIDLIDSGRFGIYHMANKGICSRFDIAKKIIEYSGRQDVSLHDISSAAYPLSAPRGRSEMIDNYKLRLLGVDRMRAWECALKEYIGKLLRNQTGQIL